MRYIILVLSLVMLAGAACGSAELGYFQGVYGVWNYSLLGELGFDAVYQEVWWTVDPPLALSKFANESVEASGHNLSYICGPYYQVTTPPFNYTRAVNINGHVESRTPSRVDGDYWRGLILEPGLAIANLSLHCPIWAIVWDMEDYMREEFTYWDYTFDDLALRMFANQTNRTIPSLDPSDRADWLRSRGILEEFQGWQEEVVYRYALDAEQQIHAINPELRLGILAFEDDSWFHLSVLRGFSAGTPEVMAWHEDTYSGYKKGKIDHNNEVFSQLGIEGKVVPGLWSLWMAPFDLLNHMEFATRDNGAFWIYQRATNPWVLGSEDDYVRIFELFRDQVWFDGNPGPGEPFQIYPGLEIRPNTGPSGVSAILDRGEAAKLNLAVASPEFSPGIGSYCYMGRNLSILERSSNLLTFEDVPCFIWELGPGDLDAIRAWSAIRELDDLLGLHERLGLPGLPEILVELNTSIRQYESGDYLHSRESALSALDLAYPLIMQQVWPTVEAGFADPRNSPVPMFILNRVYTSKRQFDEGDEEHGRIYLMNALSEWSEVPDGLVFSAIILSLSLFFQRFSSWMLPGCREVN